ncbi:hypothetical protein [Nesterenkonia pannonica]|uniref:hypothetical protein n=1 Tax=Nesterenkonia pannonica TaxID=1548602 RepID=UPI002164B683|nr:hypothetical protein [Nesterenkonia pannonica]
MIEEADQLWAAVDLRHKPDDVRVWLAVLAEHRTVDGVVLLAAEQTLTPRRAVNWACRCISRERCAEASNR